MTHGSLFSGIGGFDLAAEWMGWENKFHCEINPFGQKILNYYWPNAEQYKDITTADFNVWRGRIDILTGGFPCQDASNANQSSSRGSGLSGERTRLLYEMCRAIDEIRPKYVVAENVANILKVNKGSDFSTILTEISSMGYNAEWRICYSSEVGAPHKRARLYMVIYADYIRLQKNQSFFSFMGEKIKQERRYITGTSVSNGISWGIEPEICSLDDGIPKNLGGYAVSKWRAEAIKAPGNAVTPQIPYQIFKAIEQYEKDIPTKS